MGGGHPGLALDTPQKIYCGGDPTEHGADVPFADDSCRDRMGSTLPEHDAPVLLSLENSEAVVTHGIMPFVVKPVCGL